MTRTRSGLLMMLGLLMGVVPAIAQSAAYGHVHMNTPEPFVAVAWYIEHMGCTAFARKDACIIGTTELRFATGEPSGGSEGSGVDHIGFSFPDLTRQMLELDAAGVKILQPIREPDGFFKLAFIEDPWGTKIEIVEDEEYLGFHHVHLRSDDPEQALAWYGDIFGGERERFRGTLDALRYGSVWLIVTPAPAGTTLVPSEGRSIDHLGFNYPDLDHAAAEIRSKGVEMTDPTAYTDSIGVRRKFAFVVGPNDVRIELIQPKV